MRDIRSVLSSFSVLLAGSILSLSVSAADDDRKQAEASGREAHCRGKSNAIYFAEKSGPDIKFYFCDESMVRRRSDGSMSLRTSSPTKLPGYEDYVADARAQLEVADHNARVLKTETALNQQARARGAFDKRVKEFMKKNRWSKEQYYKAAKASKIQVYGA